jgi:hypothetical protein
VNLPHWIVDPRSGDYTDNVAPAHDRVVLREGSCGQDQRQKYDSFLHMIVTFVDLGPVRVTRPDGPQHQARGIQNNSRDVSGTSSSDFCALRFIGQ